MDIRQFSRSLNDELPTNNINACRNCVSKSSLRPNVAWTNSHLNFIHLSFCYSEPQNLVVKTTPRDQTSSARETKANLAEKSKLKDERIADLTRTEMRVVASACARELIMFFKRTSR